jgi:hypothetical protein
MASERSEPLRAHYVQRAKQALACTLRPASKASPCVRPTASEQIDPLRAHDSQRAKRALACALRQALRRS